MSGERAIWLSEADVVDMVDLAEAIAALEDGLAAEARGNAANMVKTHVAFDGGAATLHAIGAAFEGAAFEGHGVVGTKTWAHTTGGAAPLLVLFDSATGAVLAVIEAFALGQLRTSAIAGVATAHMADPAAHVLGVIGTGKQALAQVAAVLAVRPIDDVRVFSPTAAHRDGFAARVEDELAVRARAVPSVAAAVDGADVITAVTRATDPFLQPAMVASGAHINAMGAITPDRIELDPSLLDRADVIAADSVEQARRLSAELRAHLGDDEDAWATVVPLSRVVAERLGRPPGADVTVFKAMGMGISDVALGLRCLARASAEGRGTPLPDRRRVAPRLRAPITKEAP